MIPNPVIGMYANIRYLKLISKLRLHPSKNGKPANLQVGPTCEFKIIAATMSRQIMMMIVLVTILI